MLLSPEDHQQRQRRLQREAPSMQPEFVHRSEADQAALQLSSSQQSTDNCQRPNPSHGTAVQRCRCCEPRCPVPAGAMFRKLHGAIVQNPAAAVCRRFRMLSLQHNCAVHGFCELHLCVSQTAAISELWRPTDRDTERLSFKIPES